VSQQRAEHFRPPQQARSRASLHKVLASAEHVLSAYGIDEFTVAAVAEHAGMSVGAIYRRFSGKEQVLQAVKEQLLEQLETSVTDALRSACPGLDGIVSAFTHAMAHTFSHHTRTFPELLSGQRAEGIERGLQALAMIQQSLAEAAKPYLDDIHRPDPELALQVAARTIIGSCVHRAATCQSWPDGLSWTRWANETAEIAMSYLATEARRETRAPLNEGNGETS
jgi:AcrR family transcriptional regulator